MRHPCLDELHDATARLEQMDGFSEPTGRFSDAGAFHPVDSDSETFYLGALLRLEKHGDWTVVSLQSHDDALSPLAEIRRTLDRLRWLALGTSFVLLVAVLVMLWLFRRSTSYSRRGEREVALEQLTVQLSEESSS